MGIAAAASRALKGANWAEGSDPLVIDLDGVRARASGGRARGVAGWLKGDDGFLVLDGNANGWVDDISELFGNRAEGGFAELAGHDLSARGGMATG